MNMIRVKAMQFVTRRLTTLVITIFTISLITFLVFQILPGDPALFILGLDADPLAVETLRQELGLNQPLAFRYMNWFASAVSGDLGTSLRYHRPVTDLIAQGLPVTATLALMGMTFAVVAALPLGIYAAVNHRKRGDYLTMILAQLGLSTPSFWIGILLILVLAVKLQWFQPGGFVKWSVSPLLALKSLLLPAVALGVQRTAIITRMVRSSVLEALSMDYVRTARSKGLSERVVVYKHALKNALIPVVTIMGVQVVGLLSGSIILEQVFSLPGLGSLVLMAVSARDLPLLQGIVVFIATVVVSVNFLVDVVYTRLDPRIKYD